MTDARLDPVLARIDTDLPAALDRLMTLLRIPYASQAEMTWEELLDALNETSPDLVVGYIHNGTEVLFCTRFWGPGAREVRA